ncbi:DUF4265 domain-containing protein [Rhizobium sp.]|uniref:DUF4265 domain-containing protein n=1 Tax=Rhizobium sp. TaxID=391 RepID=UPI0028A1DFEE
MEKIKFEIPPNEWHGYTAEFLACREEGGGLYSVQVSPIYVKGISKGDIIECDTAVEGRIFTKIARKSGNWTYRVIVNKAPGFENVQDFLTGIFDFVEIEEDVSEGFILFSLCVRPEAVNKVYEVLERFYLEHKLDFEEANVGAPPT